MTIDDAYVWYRKTPNALSELLEMKCKHEMIVEENKKLRVDWESERDYANQMEAIAGRLQAENAKLKRRLEILKGHGIEIVDAVAGGFEIYNKEHKRSDRLQAENAKMKELVRHMGTCIQYLDRTDEDGGCVRCPYQTVEHDCGFEQRMAELGIG